MNFYGKIIEVVFGILNIPNTIWNALIFTILFTIIIDGLCLLGVFKKANVSSEKAFIPIYNTYICCKISGVDIFWFKVFLGSFVIFFIPLVGLIALLIGLYFRILLACSITKSFGKDQMFSLIFFFSKPLFNLIVSLDSSEYIGPRPMKDIFNKNNYQNNDICPAKKCGNCGVGVSFESSYCQNCGTKL